MHGSGIDRNGNLKNLEGEVTSWDVSYYVGDNEIFDKTVVFTIDELYPGMPKREETANIYNIGTTSTEIKYELISVKIFGVEILDNLKADGVIKTEGNTTDIFADDTKYPFNISYTYDKNRLDGEYVDDETTPNAVAKFKYNLKWDYQAESDKTDKEKLEQDILDTQFGKDAYAFYQNEQNDHRKAVEISVKITSSIIRESN